MLSRCETGNVLPTQTEVNMFGTRRIFIPPPCPMNTQALAQDLLASYGQLVGLPGLRFEPDGCARLLFHQSIAIDLEIDAGAGCLHAYGVLGTVPARGREALYRRLLEANLFGTQTSGATLAIDAVPQEVLLCRRVELATATAASFAEFLEDFARIIQQWQQKLGSGELAADSADAAGQDHGPGMYLRA